MLRVSVRQDFSNLYICDDHLPTLARSCLICSEEELQLPLLNFPEHRNQRAKWCHNLKIDPIPKWDNSKHICSRHFESYCFIQPGQLDPEAAPTLHLKHTDSNIFLNDYAMDSSKMMLQIKDEPLESDDLML